MVNGDIDSRIYEKLKEKVKNDKVKYPSVKKSFKIVQLEEYS